jgi:hypothetical protein
MLQDKLCANHLFKLVSNKSNPLCSVIKCQHVLEFKYQIVSNIFKIGHLFKLLNHKEREGIGHKGRWSV